MAETTPSAPVLAAIVGATRGAIAGALFAGFWAFVVLSHNGARARGGPGASDLGPMLLVVVGGALAGATLCGFDAAARQAATRASALILRLAAGAVAPIAAASPAFGLGGDAFARTFAADDLRAFAMTALAMAAGQIAAGAPTERAHEAQGCGRLARAGVATPVAFAGAMLASTGDLELISGGAGAAFGGLFFAGMFWIAQHVAAFPARWLARSLDVETADDDLDQRRRFTNELGVAAESLAAAGRVAAPTVERLLRSAKEALDRAERLSLDYTASDRQRVALRRAEVLLLQGDLEGAEQLAAATAFEPALRVELARRRGDLDRAAALASSWHDAQGVEATYTARSARANALALLALVRADQGRRDEARALLERSRAVSTLPENVFHHLTPERVEAYIEACTDRSPRA